jgi:hypothetical protein
MREILFRGKVPGDYPDEDLRGQGVEGNLVHQTEYYGNPIDRYHIIYTGEFDYDYYDSVVVIPETVRQYTGMEDKNGTKIFEGDIVRGLMDYGPAGLFERNNVVISFNETVGGYEWQYFNLDTIEVIGNIYDNPELLEEGEDECNS